VYTERGTGTRFVVYLPLLEAAGEVAAPPAPAPARGSGSVLVVDDEELVRRTAARILTRLGFEPAVAASGREALEWLERRGAPPAAVLLDLAMPEMDGRACFRAMRARHPAVRVVISSGFARNGRAQELLDEGAVAFVQKPYRAEELAQALALATAPPVAA
jgi:CheY-like chemotaxis protein